MTFRTDVEYRGGQIAVRHDTSADAKKPLPEVTLSDHLASDKWEIGFKKELAQYGYDNDHSLLSVLAAQRGMAETAQRLIKMRDNQHPSDTQYQHLNKVAREYDQSYKNHSVSRERALSTVKNRLNEIESDFRQSINYDTKDAQEIRAVLREMKPADRNEAISSAIGNGDGNVLAAILEANPIAVGLTKEQQQNYRVAALNEHRPDLLALERQLHRANKLIVKSHADLLEMGDTVTAKKVRDHYKQLAEQAEQNVSKQQG